MEIISHLLHNPERHSVVEFLKLRFKPFFIHLMDPRKVAGFLNHHTSIQAIENMISHKWTPMRMAADKLTGQTVHIKLSGGAWCHVYLIINGHGDRMVMLLSGEASDLNYIEFGYVGSEETYNAFMKQLNFTELEVTMNASHAVWDTEEG